MNAGILEAHAGGLLRSVSLMVTAEAAEDAASHARSHPGLDVGLHITLVEGRPALSPERVPSLVRSGQFWGKLGTICCRYGLGLWRPEEAGAEVEAQLDRLGELHITPSHIDGHQHLHLLPGVFPRVVAQARQRGIPFVRQRIAEPVWGAGRLARGVQLLALQGTSALARSRVPRSDGGALVSFASIGFGAAGGRLTSARLLEMLDHLRGRGESVTEVMLHPGRSDAETLRRYGHWNYEWQRDLELLLDPALAKALAARGIEVTSFRELTDNVSRQ